MSEWKNLTIPEFSEIISGATPATNVKEYWDGEIEWVTPVDLSKLHSMFLNKTIRKISEKGLKNSSATLIPANNIVMSSRAPIGYFAIPTKDFTTNQGCKSFKLNPQHNAEYHYYNFLYNIDYFKRFGSGSTFAEISKKDIEKLSFRIPSSLTEQRKIARILSSVDAVIEKTEAAIAKYKAIKAGMMHDLFTRGLDLKTGKLRPSYEDAPELYKKSELGWVPKEWEVVRIGDACINFINGGTPSTKNVDNWLGTIPWITGADFLESFKVGFIRRYITQEAISNSSTHVIKNGNILLVTRTGVGKLAIAPFDIAISQDITGLILNDERFRVNYFFVYLQLLVEDFKKMNQGTSINGIVRKDLENTLIIQPNIDEQDKVAKNVFALDRIIADEIEVLNKHQQLKSALMSDLLTGKVRVKYDENEKAEAV